MNTAIALNMNTRPLARGAALRANAAQKLRVPAPAGPLRGLCMSKPLKAVNRSLKVSAAAGGAPSTPPLTLPPPAVFKAAANVAAAKASYPVSKTFLLGIMAGCFIGFGALLMTCVGGASPVLAANNPGACQFLKGAIGLPTGLALVIMTGSELFTGNTMVMAAGVLEKKCSFGDLMKNWIVSYSGNFVGSVLFAMLSCAAMTTAAPAAFNAAVGTAVAKASLPWTVAFCKGILCNWLVCLAVWTTMASQTTAGKIIGLWFPITAFIAMGFEHSVANMFLLPNGMFQGAAISWGDIIFKNLIPVTLGNIVAGAIFISLAYWFTYGDESPLSK